MSDQNQILKIVLQLQADVANGVNATRSSGAHL